MYLCPKDTNFFAYFDELLLFCVEQTIGPFTNTIWIDTRVIEKWKRVENQAYPLRPMVQFWWFQCVIGERSKHCVHMKRHIYCQNSSIMSQQHSFENKSWPLDDLEIWPFDHFTLWKYASKLAKMLQNSNFANKIHINGVTLTVNGGGLDLRC